MTEITIYNLQRAVTAKVGKQKLCGSCVLHVVFWWLTFL